MIDHLRSSEEDRDHTFTLMRESLAQPQAHYLSMWLYDSDQTSAMMTENVSTPSATTSTKVCGNKLGFGGWLVAQRMMGLNGYSSQSGPHDPGSDEQGRVRLMAQLTPTVRRCWVHVLPGNVGGRSWQRGEHRAVVVDVGDGTGTGQLGRLAGGTGECEGEHDGFVATNRSQGWEERKQELEAQSIELEDRMVQDPRTAEWLRAPNSNLTNENTHYLRSWDRRRSEGIQTILGIPDFMQVSEVEDEIHRLGHVDLGQACRDLKLKVWREGNKRYHILLVALVLMDTAAADGRGWWVHGCWEQARVGAGTRNGEGANGRRRWERAGAGANGRRRRRRGGRAGGRAGCQRARVTGSRVLREEYHMRDRGTPASG
ncbi:hypothetical protein C8F01DRAFT_1230211, partial [Mycena amicta]